MLGQLLSGRGTAGPMSQEGKILAPLPGRGWVGWGSVCVGASALPADSGYSLHLRNLEVDDQKHTCLPVHDTYVYRGNKDIPLPL